MGPVMRQHPRVFYGWWVLVITAMALFFSAGSSHWTYTVLLDPMAEEFDTSHSQMLGVLAFSGVLSAIFAPLLGIMVDRYGARAVMTFSLLLYGLTVMGASQVEVLWQFYLLYGGGLGLSGAAMWRVGGPAVAANWFIRRRSIAFASFSVAAATSGLIFPMLAQEIVDWRDWRAVWLIFGTVIVLVPTPLAWLIIRRRPEDMGLSPDGVTAGTSSEPSAPAGPVSTREVVDVSWSLKEAVRTRVFWLMTGSLVLTAFPSLTILAVMHPYFTELGISTGTASRLVSVFGLGVLIGAFLWGASGQLWPVRFLLPIIAALYGVSIAIVTLLGDASVVYLYIALVPLGVTTIGEAQIGNQVWGDYFGRRYVGSIIGLSGLFRTIPMALAPIVAGVIHDSFDSYRNAFALFACMCFVAAVGLTFARPPRKQPARLQAIVDRPDPPD